MQKWPPNTPLGNLPTPVHRLRRASKALGVELWIKRDDLTGSALSGNKIRKLTYLLSEAQREHADLVLTCGGAQSNHARATAVAAAQLGMKSRLFLRGAADAPVMGNLFLDRLVGAEIVAITREEYARRDEIMADAADALRREGRRPYVVPEGGSNALGSLGYVDCVRELVSTVEGPRAFDRLICAVGSGGTLAGLVLGQQLYRLAQRTIGIAVCDDSAYFSARVQAIIDDAVSRFALPAVTLAQWATVDDRFIGEGYGITQPEVRQMIRWLAQTEGVILDPVYSGKAFYGLTELIARGEIAAGSRVLFLHTGGIFGLFRGDEAEMAGQDSSA